MMSARRCKIKVSSKAVLIAWKLVRILPIPYKSKKNPLPIFIVITQPTEFVKEPVQIKHKIFDP